jgi:hypothetical protein
MAEEHISKTGWLPVQGSYEESVMSWHEQIELSFRRRDPAVRQMSSDSASRRQAQSPPVAEPGPGVLSATPAAAEQTW